MGIGTSVLEYPSQKRVQNTELRFLSLGFLNIITVKCEGMWFRIVIKAAAWMFMKFPLRPEMAQALRNPKLSCYCHIQGCLHVKSRQ